jgi:cell wall assembly regulator SMI1
MLNEIKAAQRDLLNVGVKDVSLETTPPVTAGTLQDLESRIGRRLPDGLRQIFLQDAGGLKFRWTTDVFGPGCSRGLAWLLTPQAIAEMFKEQVGMAEEAKRDGLDTANDGYKALVRDWPRWVPVFRFPSGDCFCLDLSDPGIDPPIVFLEHDVMDGGPNLHGLRIAKNIGDLVTRWSSVLFADPYDWTKAVVADGIDKNAAAFGPLRQVPRASQSP